MTKRFRKREQSEYVLSHMELIRGRQAEIKAKWETEPFQQRRERNRLFQLARIQQPLSELRRKYLKARGRYSQFPIEQMDYQWAKGKVQG